MKKEPALVIQACDCGDRRCTSITMAMLRPTIKPLEGTAELCCVLQLPLSEAQGVIDQIRKLAAEKGFNLR